VGPVEGRKHKLKDYSEKVVYVIGGSSGIGLAAAELFTARGAHVCLFARNEERLEAACAIVARRAATRNQRCAYYSMDVSDHRQVQKVMARAVKAFGIPDMLINCAGQATPRTFEEVTYEQFDETIKINLYGTWNTVAALLPVMKKRGGTIVNTSSIAGFIGVFGYTDYNASKFAVLGFSEALRAELIQYGIAVSVLCPPDTDTPGLVVEKLTKPPETVAITKGAGLMSAEAVARAMIRGMEKGQFAILPGIEGKFSVLAQRFIPGVVRWTLDRTAKKVQKGLRKPE
jgi:short-subunit dehydrogenase